MTRDRIDTRTTEAPNGSSPLEDVVAGRYAALSPANRFSGMMARGERLYRFGTGPSLVGEIFGRWGRDPESGREQLPYVRGAGRPVSTGGESGASEEAARERVMPGQRTGSAGAQQVSGPTVNASPPAGVDLPGLPSGMTMGPEGGLRHPSPRRGEAPVPLTRQSARTARVAPHGIRGDEAGRPSVAEAPGGPGLASETMQGAGHRSVDGDSGVSRNLRGGARAPRESAVPELPKVTRPAGAGDPDPLWAREHGPSDGRTGKRDRPILLRRLPDRAGEGGEGGSLPVASGPAQVATPRSGGQTGVPLAVGQAAAPPESRLCRGREVISSLGSDRAAGSWPVAPASFPLESVRSNDVMPAMKATVRARPVQAAGSAQCPAASSEGRSAAVTRLPLAMSRPAPAREIAELRGEGITGTGLNPLPGGAGQAASGEVLSSPGPGMSSGGLTDPAGMPEPVPGGRPLSPAAGMSREELEQVAERVYEIIEQRLVVEKERRGF